MNLRQFLWWVCVSYWLAAIIAVVARRISSTFGAATVYGGRHVSSSIAKVLLTAPPPTQGEPKSAEKDNSKQGASNRVQTAAPPTAHLGVLNTLKMQRKTAFCLFYVTGITFSSISVLALFIIQITWGSEVPEALNLMSVCSKTGVPMKLSILCEHLIPAPFQQGLLASASIWETFARSPQIPTGLPLSVAASLVSGGGPQDTHHSSSRQATHVRSNKRKKQLAELQNIWSTEAAVLKLALQLHSEQMASNSTDTVNVGRNYKKAQREEQETRKGSPSHSKGGGRDSRSRAKQRMAQQAASDAIRKKNQAAEAPSPSPPDYSATSVMRLVPSPSILLSLLSACPLFLFLLHCFVRLAETFLVHKYRDDGSDTVTVFAAISGCTFYVVAAISLFIGCLELFVSLAQGALALLQNMLVTIENREQSIEGKPFDPFSSEAFTAQSESTTDATVDLVNAFLGAGGVLLLFVVVIFIFSFLHILLQLMQVAHHYVLGQLQERRKAERRQMLDSYYKQVGLLKVHKGKRNKGASKGQQGSDKSDAMEDKDGALSDTTAKGGRRSSASSASQRKVVDDGATDTSATPTPIMAPSPTSSKRASVTPGDDAKDTEEGTYGPSVSSQSSLGLRDGAITTSKQVNRKLKLDIRSNVSHAHSGTEDEADVESPVVPTESSFSPSPKIDSPVATSEAFTPKADASPSYSSVRRRKKGNSTTTTPKTPLPKVTNSKGNQPPTVATTATAEKPTAVDDGSDSDDPRRFTLKDRRPSSLHRIERALASGASIKELPESTSSVADVNDGGTVSSIAAALVARTLSGMASRQAKKKAEPSTTALSNEAENKTATEKTEPPTPHSSRAEAPHLAAIRHLEPAYIFPDRMLFTIVLEPHYGLEVLQYVCCLAFLGVLFLLGDSMVHRGVDGVLQHYNNNNGQAAGDGQGGLQLLTTATAGSQGLDMTSKAHLVNKKKGQQPFTEVTEVSVNFVLRPEPLWGGDFANLVYGDPAADADPLESTVGMVMHLLCEFISATPPLSILIANDSQLCVASILRPFLASLLVLFHAIGPCLLLALFSLLNLNATAEEHRAFWARVGVAVPRWNILPFIL